MADEFVDQVRSKGSKPKLKLPTQIGFNRDDWEAAYRAVAAPSVADARVFLAGLWVDDSLRQARSIIPDVQAQGIGRHDLLRLYVGAVNHIVELDSSDLLERAATIRASPHADELDAPRDGIRAPVEFADAVSSFVDSARYAVAEATRAQLDGSAAFDDDREVAHRIAAVIRVGRLYAGVENLWHECLWNGWYIARNQDGDLVVPGDFEVERARAVGATRRESLNWEVGAWALSLWRALPDEEKAERWRRPSVVGIEPLGRGRVRPILGIRGVDLATPPAEFPLRQLAEEFDYGFLPDEPLPRLGGLTVRRLCDVWALLATLGETIQRSLPAAEADPLPRDVLEFAPVVQLGELVSAVSSGFGLPTDLARKAVNVFVSDGTARSDLWLEPLVRVSEREVCPVLPALGAPNLTRSIEHWMDIGGLNMSRRGKLFEEAFRKNLRAQNRLARAHVVPHAVDVANEIDLVIRLGSTFLVGEVKCTVFPTEPYEYYTYWNTLSKAAEQANYRAQVLRADCRGFLSKIGMGHLHGASLTFLPVVVTNVPMGAGMDFDGVPVVDQLILSRFFAEGGLPSMVTHSLDGMVVGEEIRFYRSASEAETAIAGYLSSPPQVAMLRNWIVTERVPLFPPELVHNPPNMVHVRVRFPDREPFNTGGEQSPGSRSDQVGQ